MKIVYLQGVGVHLCLFLTTVLLTRKMFRSVLIRILWAVGKKEIFSFIAIEEINPQFTILHS